MLEVKTEAVEVPRLKQMDIYPVILCGGSGTRLWPISRRDFAKQYAPIFGNKSPFEMTLERLAPGDRFASPLVITSPTSRFVVSDQAKAIGIDIDIALEPVGRDTLAAIPSACLLVARRDPGAIVLVAPSDHLISDHDAFRTTLPSCSRFEKLGKVGQHIQ